MSQAHRNVRTGGMWFGGRFSLIQTPNRDILNPGNELSIVAWVSLANTVLDQKIVGKSPIGSGYILGVIANRLYPEIWDSNGTKYAFMTGYIAPNAWTFLAITWKSGGRFRGYVNGNMVYDGLASELPIRPNAMPLRVGCAPWNVNLHQLLGIVGEVRIYNRALEPSEIAKLYYGQDVREGLVLHYDFSEGEGYTVYDKSGYNNHGTAYGYYRWVVGRASRALRASRVIPVSQDLDGDGVVY